VPCWLVFDETYRRSYSIGTLTPDAPTPRWVCEAPTLRELAEKLGVDADGLVDQVERFNQAAAEGHDPEFHRGESAYDRYRGDKSHKPHRNLGPLDDSPYYAVELHYGCIGTKGGPVINESGQVLDTDERPIPGLYACGNVAASLFGPAYPGAGCTLGAGMAVAYLIGVALSA
jgi:3-oxosteroid 1-dehydrogenase